MAETAEAHLALGDVAARHLPTPPRRHRRCCRSLQFAATPNAHPRAPAPTPPAGAADLFALDGNRLSLADLGLAETPRISNAELCYVIDESRSFVASKTSNDGATHRRSVAPASASHPKHAAVVVRGLGQAQLHEDAAHVLLDRSLGHPELAPDARVRATLGHERQDL